MRRAVKDFCRQFLMISTLVLALFTASPARAGSYDALQGVKGLDTVFDVTLGDPQAATVVFPAIMEVYRDQSVRDLPAPPRTVIVFHDAAVNLISGDGEEFDAADRKAFDKARAMIREFKKDGVKLEVCMYAVKALGVDPATLMPEIDRVGNGFTSVAGYQARGFSLVVVH